MVKKYFKTEVNSIQERFRKRKILLKPFLKKYGKPVLVHAAHEKEIFKKILNEGKLKLPSTHQTERKTPFMEEMLGNGNGIYYSLGFVYNTAYGWKYNFLLDLNYLKRCKYYINSINYQCHKKIIDYWDKEDIKQIQNLASINEHCKAVVDKYYNVKYLGKTKRLFDFWKVQDEMAELIRGYPDQKKIKEIIQKVEKKYSRKYPTSLKNAKESCSTERTPEVICFEENDLLNNRYFLGFYIEEKIPKDILSILKKKYSSKIIFDGKKIKNIYELK